MLEYLNRLEEITGYLNDDFLKNKINFIKDTINDRKFLLTFVGQFSSGKSRLINNILDMELLPVRILECTQVPTFIKYGTDERAIIFNEDSTTTEININDIKEIWLGNKIDKFKNIAHIEIFINNNILKNGLVIADTPGINSTLEKHERLTREILKSSEEIVYVISKPVTERDKLFLNEIISLGLRVICVRTYMDTIKSSEENIEDVILHDKNSIKDLGDNSIINIYHISNERNSIWFNKIEVLKRYISVDIIKNIDSKLEESCKLRLVKIKNELNNQLENKKISLECILKNNEKELLKEVNEIDEALNKLEIRLENRKSNYNKNIKDIKLEAKKDLIDMKDNILRDVKNEIINTSLYNGVEDRLNSMIYKKLSDSIKSLQEIYVNPFDNFINDNSILIENEISNVLSDINVDYNIPSSIENLIIEVEEDELENNKLKREILEISKDIEKKEQQLELLKYDSKKYEEEKNRLYEAIKEIEIELENHGTYQPRYIEDDSEHIQPSEILKIIGNGLDWATLIIPSKAYGQVATKIAPKLGKWAVVAEKTGQNLKKADSVKDSFFALKNIKNVAKSTYKTKKRTKNALKTLNTIGEISNNAKNKGMLDIITFEYWFEKAGKCFDKPVEMQIDKEYEREYNETKRLLTEKYSKLKNAEIEKLQKLGMIKTEEERLRKIKDLEIKRNKILMQELQEREEKIKLLAKQRAFEAMKNEYYNRFEDLIEELSNTIIIKCDKFLKLPLEMYYEKCIGNIKFEINKHKQIKEKILEKFKQNGINEVEQELIQCNRYLELIKG